jgi:hypothetical protein
MGRAPFLEKGWREACSAPGHFLYERTGIECPPVGSVIPGFEAISSLSSQNPPALRSYDQLHPRLVVEPAMCETRAASFISIPFGPLENNAPGFLERERTSLGRQLSTPFSSTPLRAVSASRECACHAVARRGYFVPFLEAGAFFGGAGDLAASASREPVVKLTRFPAGM